MQDAKQAYVVIKDRAIVHIDNDIGRAIFIQEKLGCDFFMVNVPELETIEEQSNFISDFLVKINKIDKEEK